MTKTWIGVLCGLACFAIGACSALTIVPASATAPSDDPAASIAVVPGKHDEHFFHVVAVQGDRMYVVQFPAAGETPLEVKPIAILKP